MKQILRKNAGVIGLLATGSFAALLLVYVVYEVSSIPVFFIWFGLACVLADGLTLWALRSIDKKTKSKKKGKK